MATINLVFSTLTAANPYTIGSAPDNLTGYSVPGTANQGKIYGSPKVWSMASGTNATWRNDTQLTSSVISSKIKLPSPVSSNAVCVALLDSSHNGILVITGTGTNNFRLFAVANGVLSGGALRTDAVAPIAGATIELRRTISGANHDYEIFQNGSKIGATYTNNTYNAQYGACMSRGGDLAEFAVEYTPAQTVVSINSGNDIIQGATGTAALLNGFTSRPTSITTNQTGLTCSNIGGTTNAPTWDNSGWAEGQQYPSLPVNVNFTFTFNTETTTGTETVTYPVTHTKVVFSSTPDITSLDGMGYWLNSAGHVVAGGDWYHTTFSDLVCDSDARISVTGTGIFTGYFRPFSGSTAGRVYYWEFEVVDGSITSATGGLVTRGLTETGLIARGLVTRGL